MANSAQSRRAPARKHHRADNEFLNPKSMITPGAAGAMVMVISNSLWVAFGLPAEWSALLFSFLFSAMVVGAYLAPVWQKALLVVFNSLIVFSLGVGTTYVGKNAFGSGAESANASPAVQEPVANVRSNFILELIPAAVADDGAMVLAQRKRGFWDPWFKPKKDGPP